MGRKRSPLVILAAWVTLGSGIINLYSLMTPALPGRLRRLHELFPVEFIHLSKFLTLLIGLALLISSLNIYRRKRRAWRIVLFLACCSFFFHMTKGLDYEEGLASLVLAGILWISRDSYTAGSGTPSLRSAVSRLTMGFAGPLLYGILGFWLLDKRDFGINFHMGDAVRRTLLFVSLVGDPGIEPHTRHAVWFLHSLSLLTVAALAYAAYSLFRPVLYQYRTLPYERDTARDILSRQGHSSLDFFKVWADKSFFFSASRQSFLAYRVSGRFAVVLGDPVGPDAEIESIIRDFREMCQENDWRVIFHQVTLAFLAVYKKIGFRRLKIGDEATVDLTSFCLEGKSTKKLRHTVNQFEKDGIQGVWVDPPIADQLLTEAKDVSDEWLQLPGRRERGFTLGRFDIDYLRTTPLFLVRDSQGRMLAFANAIPSYRTGEATIDLMRRRNDAPNGTMDYLFVKLFLRNKEQGFTRFSLGMAPMSGFTAREAVTAEEKAAHFFLHKMSFLFSFEGLIHYKAKFASSWEPRYLIYRHPLELPSAALALARVSEIGEKSRRKNRMNEKAGTLAA